MFGSLLKATVGLVVETPIAVIKDTAKFLTLEDVNETEKALKKVSKNISEAHKELKNYTK